MDAVALRRNGWTVNFGRRLYACLDFSFSRRFRLAGFSSHPIQLASGAHGGLSHRPLRPRYSFIFTYHPAVLL